MKLKKALATSFFTAALICTIVLGFFYIYSENSSQTHRVHEHLEFIIESKVELIESFLEARKARAVDFSSDGFIKSSLVKLSNDPFSVQVMEDLSRHLSVNKLPLEKDFYGVMVLDINGKVVGTTNPEEDFGTDFSDTHMFLMGKKQPYLKEVFYDEKFRHKGIAISAPVLVDDKALGVVVIKLLPESFYRIASARMEFGKTEDIYTVNKEKYLITPSRFLKGEDKGVLVQKIDDENSRACFDEGTIGHSERDEPVISFLDYRGEEAIGTHRELLGVNWCLAAQIDKSEAIDKPLKNYILNQVIVSALVIATVTLSGFFVGKLWDKRYEVRKK